MARPDRKANPGIGLDNIQPRPTSADHLKAQAMLAKAQAELVKAQNESVWYKLVNTALILAAFCFVTWVIWR